MIKNKTKILILGFLVAILLIPTATLAQKGKGNKSNYGNSKMTGIALGQIWKNPALISQLGLTDDQVEKLRQISFDYREKGITLRSDIQKTELELEKAMTKRPVDLAATKKIASRLGDLKKTRFMQFIDHHLAVYSLLTKEQQIKLDQYVPANAKSFNRNKRIRSQFPDPPDDSDSGDETDND